ncbi:LytR/AlgR family response regulator transcription factor [Portibacter lacus]|uniref:DNA-binding response regulator n=1 Tax=Portibacter lacus TaxID=1099794 RepID=A0AA37SQT7_9BACT|nr:response regulator transcription factor [Portibacter lacus]GLR18019.1 DNA-binding response regulator [Portibacter lacus]
MSRHSCIIIEDEPLALERTKNFVEKVPTLELLGCFEDAISGLNFLTGNQVDILFLDINMDELTGIELLESYQVSSEIIITTAYQQYALKGYELNVTDYLLKPFTFPRFLQAVHKAQGNLKLKSSQSESDFIFIKTEHKLVKILFDEILYIEGMRDYRRIFVGDKSIMTLEKFTDLEVIIPNDKVCRVHKSYMVSLSKIDHIERNRIRIGTKIIPISTTYKSSFFKLIKN